MRKYLNVTPRDQETGVYTRALDIQMGRSDRCVRGTLVGESRSHWAGPLNKEWLS